MSTKYVYQGGKSRTWEDNFAKATFPTKADTAEDYPFYFYFPELTTWRAPRHPESSAWKEVLKEFLQDGTFAMEEIDGILFE